MKIKKKLTLSENYISKILTGKTTKRTSFMRHRFKLTLLFMVKSTLPRKKLKYLKNDNNYGLLLTIHRLTFSFRHSVKIQVNSTF